MKKVLFRQFISVVVLSCLSMSSVFAQQNIFRRVSNVKENSQQLPQINRIEVIEKRPIALVDFKLPSNSVMIKDTYKGLGKKTVVLIQDAHCNAEAQINISKAVEYCARNYGVRLLCVEGSVGIIDVSAFRHHPEPDLVRDCIAFFMKKGRITGCELYAIQAPYEMTLFGIENQELYDLNLNAFKNTMPLRSQFYSGISSLEEAFKKLAPKVYAGNRELKTFHEKIKKYEQEEIDFSTHGEYLVEKLKRHNVNLKMYQNLVLFSKVSYYEKRIDFELVSQERSKLTESLLKTISRRYADEMKVKSDYYVNGKMTTGEFYTYLINLARRHKIAVESYSNLLSYQIYMSAFEKLNHDEVLNEMLLAEDVLGQKMSKNEDQAQLDSYERALRKLKSFYKLEMSQHDLDFYNNNKKDFSAAGMFSFIGILARRYDIPVDLSSDIVNLDNHYTILNEFYRYARERDVVLTDNTLDKMDDMGIDIAVQTTGGFHTDGITRILRERKISFITCAPRITKESDPDIYLDVLLNRTSYFEYVKEFSDFREKREQERQDKKDEEKGLDSADLVDENI